MIHHFRQDQAAGQPDDGRLAYLRGKLAYLAMLNPKQALALQARMP